MQHKWFQSKGFTAMSEFQKGMFVTLGVVFALFLVGLVMKAI